MTTVTVNAPDQHNVAREIARGYKKTAHSAYAVSSALLECLSYSAINPEFEISILNEWGRPDFDISLIKNGYTCVLMIDSTNPNRVILGKAVKGYRRTAIGFAFFLKNGNETTQIDLNDW